MAVQICVDEAWCPGRIEHISTTMCPGAVQVHYVRDGATQAKLLCPWHFAECLRPVPAQPLRESGEFQTMVFDDGCGPQAAERGASCLTGSPPPTTSILGTSDVYPGLDMGALTAPHSVISQGSSRPVLELDAAPRGDKETSLTAAGQANATDSFGSAPKEGAADVNERSPGQKVRAGGAVTGLNLRSAVHPLSDEAVFDAGKPQSAEPGQKPAARTEGSAQTIRTVKPPRRSRCPVQ
eukprot:gnl/TRDRNA2_/TRDRNA2_148477_c0_seq1.p1 gnl/TRDRNA2_/TRDRNA2_148477_c0~~gnl/TRDRNA2_/TRDRNA2_148477_c0_seq1.p1  ORF type:complete len:251 (-),score=29.32 gnl/TRDRNA2_/TRDRNA2_148477_c0_seq1:73-786(-)